jgi:hypothetical protein
VFFAFLGNLFIGNPDPDCKLSFPLEKQIDRLHREGKLPDPTSSAIIRWMHREFLKDMPPGFRHLEGVEVVLGEWRAEPPEVAVGQHHPPSCKLFSLSVRVNTPV